ncbi:alpha/beta hydrolase [Colwellia echini]|uniref:Alpha/beta fold hydrolase n=1 Tax=Colwellia echini TaxID=1982103 RepID=A0ABY3MV33_9GAMM|nr:alpha/beta fold hydrolase [Colwellia echini]TYK64974.1 alpha/beta fold hydrolase [Colwellia echini]
MFFITKSILLFAYLFSTWSFAESQNKLQDDCVNIKNNYVALTESGKYRYTKASSVNSDREIDFNKLENYQQYVTAATQLINNKNPRASMPCPIITETYQQLAKQNNWSATPTVSQLVAPYELTQTVKSKSSKGILLIHGLTDSPFSFHDLSQFFYQQGFTVRTLLLPGHGTAPSDLLSVEYSQWQQATSFAIEQTLNDFDTVYLGGLSTGGALIFNYLRQQKEVDKKVKGLFLWSPASKAKNDLAWLAQYVDLIPFVDWLDLDADIDFAKYESFTYNAAAQVEGIMSLVAAEKSLVNTALQHIPLFVVASEHDETIDTKYTLELIQQRQTTSTPEKMKQSVLVYYGNKENLPENMTEVMTVIVPECSPERLCSEVFDVSHISTTNSPDNPHYGVQGQYRNCGHYASDVESYHACKHNKQVNKGEVTQINLLRDIPMQRLTYNPYYEEMLKEMARFLNVTE